MNFLKNSAPLLIICGVVSGFINGLLGAGGGIIIVFILSKFMKNDASPRDIFANALCVMLPVSAVSCIIYSLRGQISFEGFPSLIIPAVAGGILGGLLLCKIKTNILKTLFAILVVISGVILVLK